MSLKISACAAALVPTLAMLSPPLISTASAQHRAYSPTSLNCRIVGAISHRCYYFHSDANWREGLADYHGSNGG